MAAPAPPEKGRMGLSRGWRGIGAATALAIAGLLLAAAAASAATVSSTATTVTYQSQQPVSNAVEVRYDAARAVYLIREPLPGFSFTTDDEALSAGAGCTRDPDQPDEHGFIAMQQVACPGPRAEVVVNLAGGQDLASVSGDPPGTVSLVGGPAGDALLGGSGADTLLGGAAEDLLEGSSGGDVLDEGTTAGPGGIANAGVFGYTQDRFTFNQSAQEFAAAVNADGGDTISGGSGRMHLLGQGGADTIRPAAANGLFVEGGSGDDRILGGGSKLAPSVDGGDGDDRISGFLGKLVIQGGDGKDILAGNAKNTLRGDGGNDELSGATIAGGGSGADKITGTAKDDVLFGEEGDDLLRGGGGDDDLDGNYGSDTAFGGPGNDHFSKLFHSGGCKGVELYVGESGRDTAYLSCGIMRLRLKDGAPDVISCRVPAPVAVAKVLSKDPVDRILGCAK